MERQRLLETQQRPRRAVWLQRPQGDLPGTALIPGLEGMRQRIAAREEARVFQEQVLRAPVLRSNALEPEVLGPRDHAQGSVAPEQGLDPEEEAARFLHE
eukprot:7282215-Pyramimonas_sp.AAC.1